MRELQNFLYSLLGKRKRRLLILTRWHTTKCVDGKDTQEVLFNFLQIILYQPLEISLHKEYVKLFAIHGLHIPYDWLLPSERKFIMHAFYNRLELFKHREFYLNGNFTLKTLRGELPIEYRRELVRDLVWFSLSMKGKQQIGAVLFLRIFQKLLIERPEPDRFVREMHEALQGRCKIREVLCVF